MASAIFKIISENLLWHATGPVALVWPFWTASRTRSSSLTIGDAFFSQKRSWSCFELFLEVSTQSVSLLRFDLKFYKAFDRFTERILFLNTKTNDSVFISIDFLPGGHCPLDTVQCLLDLVSWSMTFHWKSDSSGSTEKTLHRFKAKSIC